MPAVSRAAPMVRRAVRRAVVLDLDGTALSSSNILRPQTIKAIRRASALNIPVIIGTGRPLQAVLPFIEELELPRPVPAVLFNGACGMLLRARTCPSEQQVLFSQALSAPAADRILAVCQHLGCCVSFYGPLGAVAAPQSATHERLLQRFESLEGVVQVSTRWLHRPTCKSRWERTRIMYKQERVEHSEILAAVCDLPLKIVALSESPDKCAEEARAALPVGLAHIIAAEMHVEFVHPAANKGRALARLCRQELGLQLQDVVAFGDNLNDKEMLVMVGEGVAMRNAKDSLKEVADRVCMWSNDEDGVARELNSLLDSGILSASDGAV